MPRSFQFPPEDGQLDQAQLWVPLSLTAEELSDEHAGFWGYRMVGRLKDGVTQAQAAQDTDRVAKQIMRNFPAHMSALHIRGDVMSLYENAVADVRPLLRTLFLAVSIVLLIACVERRRPVAGASDATAARVCGAAGAGSASRRDYARIDFRRVVAERGGRTIGNGICRDRDSNGVASFAGVNAPRGLDCDGREGCHFRIRSSAGDGYCLQPGTGFGGVANESDGDA